jgi:hypothetical protein
MNRMDISSVFVLEWAEPHMVDHVHTKWMERNEPKRVFAAYCPAAYIFDIGWIAGRAVSGCRIQAIGAEHDPILSTDVNECISHAKLRKKILELWRRTVRRLAIPAVSKRQVVGSKLPSPLLLTHHGEFLPDQM